MQFSLLTPARLCAGQDFDGVKSGGGETFGNTGMKASPFPSCEAQQLKHLNPFCFLYMAKLAADSSQKQKWSRACIAVYRKLCTLQVVRTPTSAQRAGIYSVGSTQKSQPALRFIRSYLSRCNGPLGRIAHRLLKYIRTTHIDLDTYCIHRYASEYRMHVCIHMQLSMHAVASWHTKGGHV